MKLHERHEIVTKADLDISKAVCDVVENSGLTHAELMGILLKVAQSWNRFAIRDERETEQPV